MGWLWSSTPAVAPPPLPQENTPPPTHLTSDAIEEQPKPKILTRDEAAEQELHSFLAEITADTKASSTKYNRVPKAPSPTTRSTALNATTDDSDLPLSEQLLPTYMSCRTAFDEAFYCNSFGGKFNDLYRYGALRPCTENWSKFWFCMRTRTWSAPEKKEAIRDWYRKREQAKYEKVTGKDGVVEGGSSEDIWKTREVKEEYWGFDKVNPDDYRVEGEGDGGWNERERERRRMKVQDMENGTVK